MTDDIVKRLRQWTPGVWPDRSLDDDIRDAADEIERLRRADVSRSIPTRYDIHANEAWGEAHLDIGVSLSGEWVKWDDIASRPAEDRNAVIDECAKVCDAKTSQYDLEKEIGISLGARRCAAAIRALKRPDNSDGSIK